MQSSFAAGRIYRRRGLGPRTVHRQRYQPDEGAVERRVLSSISNGFVQSESESRFRFRPPMSVDATITNACGRLRQLGRHSYAAL